MTKWRISPQHLLHHSSINDPVWLHTFTYFQIIKPSCISQMPASLDSSLSDRLLRQLNDGPWIIIFLSWCTEVFLCIHNAFIRHYIHWYIIYIMYKNALHFIIIFIVNMIISIHNTFNSKTKKPNPPLLSTYH